MTTLKVVDGDITTDFSFTSDASEYIVQKIKNRLLVFKNEWFLNRELGIPYFQEVFEKQPNFRFIPVLFSNEILKINGISEVTEIEISSYNASRREMSIFFRCTYLDSEIQGVLTV